MDNISAYAQQLIGIAKQKPAVAAAAAAVGALGLIAVTRLFGCSSKQWDVKGKVVLITGASSGIGRSLATHLVRLGAKYEEDKQPFIFPCSFYWWKRWMLTRMV